MTPLALARIYLKRGWTPVPVSRATKKPIGIAWQKRRITAETAPRYFNGAAMNVGVQMGPYSGGLTDVDLDCAEAVAIGAMLLPRTEAIFGRKSKPRSHWLYTTGLAGTSDKATERFEDDGAVMLELRVGGGGKGAQSVFPGSVHTSGEPIEWDHNGAPAEVDGAELSCCVSRVAVAALLARYWPANGSRHEAALTVGGFLARAGLNEDAAALMVQAIATAAGDDEVADREQAARDAVKQHGSGGATRGFPKLVEAFGKKVARTAADWIGYASVGQDAPSVEPIDLWASFPPPELPTGLLPEVIERFARVEARTMGCDVAGLAMGALVVCAAAISDDIQLQVKKHTEYWRESARIWAALIGEPSAKKSPILRRVAAPLVRIDRRLHGEYVAALILWNKIPKNERPDPPPQPRVRLEDVTIEAAQEVLKDSPDGLLCLQDELSGWFGAIDKYSAGNRGAAKDRGFWLETYNGGEHPVNRINRGSMIIPNLSVCMLGGIQPEPMRRLAADSVDNGLIQRLCPIVLAPATVGLDEPDGGEWKVYDTLVDSLHRMTTPKFALRFDDDAQTIRNQLERRHLELTNCGAINKKLGAHIGKYDGLFARLCVLFHCIENVDRLPPIVTADTAQRVADFLRKFLFPHAVAFYAGTLGLSDDHDRLSAVAGYILAHRLDVITRRDMQRGDRTMRKLTKRDTDGVFEQLEAFGWITQGNGPRPSPIWNVNPRVHKLFAERAAQEKQRRAHIRATIVEVTQP